MDILTHTKEVQKEPESKIYLFRNLLKFSPFDEESREKHQKDLEKYEIWKKDQLKQQQEYGIGKKSQQEQDSQFDVQLKILESRRTDYNDETYSQTVKNYENFFFQNLPILKEYQALTEGPKEPDNSQRIAPCQLSNDQENYLPLTKAQFAQMKEYIDEANKPVEKVIREQPVKI